VALGRAIVRQPKVFLFDEPLSNLDANLRVQMRTEISRLHQRLRTTMIYVTHDQIEAMSMGDRIVVMKDGLVQQVDTPLNLYHNPVNRFVAGFIGSPTMNFFMGTFAKEDSLVFHEEGTSFVLPVPGAQHPHLGTLAGHKVVLGIRPEHISLSSERGPGKAHTQRVAIEVVEPVGNEVFVYFSTGSGQTNVARLPSDSAPQDQSACELSFDTSKALFFDAASGETLRPTVH
jgi:multiple sugar transport system ATP-binding protein